MEKIAQINKKIVEKYNNFFLEAVEYYDLESMPMKTSFNGMKVIDISKLAERLEMKLEYDTTFECEREELNYILDNFGLLYPFYSLYVHYYDTSFTKKQGVTYLMKINNVLMEIRKSK